MTYRSKKERRFGKHHLQFKDRGERQATKQKEVGALYF
jgi:hypothetical protein